MVRRCIKLTLLSLICWLTFSVSLFWVREQAFATGTTTNEQTTNNTAPQSVINLAAILDVILNFLYIIIRPLLAITGLALDNSLVYGWIFQMTDMLYKFWRVMMNISFILLTLLILRDIISIVFSWHDIRSAVKDKLIKWFLAGILIPASRWILAALIDLSTILIYQVWSLPMSILWSNDQLNIPILNQSSIINLTDVQSSDTNDKWWYRFYSTFTCGDKGTVYLPCQFKDNKVSSADRSQYINDNKTKYSGDQAMVTSIEQGKAYCVLSPTQLLHLWWKDFDLTQGRWKENADMKKALDEWLGCMNGQGEKCTACSKVKELIDWSKSMVWPLYHIYGSLLNFTSLNVTSSARSTEAEVILFLIKTIVWLFLIIPLIALAFTSLARIGILRVVIAFSPFIALYKIFWWGKEGKWNMIEGIWSNMSFEFGWWFMKFAPKLEEIVNLIFQPALVVFALWVSLIFLTATNKMLSPQWTEDGLLQAIGIDIDNQDPNYQTFTVHNNKEEVTSIKMKKFSWVYSTDIFFDYFSWILANIFGIMIMRKMMFRALGSSKLTGKIADTIGATWLKFMKTRPVFWWFSYNSIAKVSGDIKDTIEEKMTKDSSKENADQLSKRINARMPGSNSWAEFNSKFKPIESTSGGDISWEALKSFDKWLSEVSQNNDKYHYLNQKDAPWFVKLAQQAGISWNSITDMVNEDSFWKKMATVDKGATIKYIGDVKNRASVAKNIAWITESEQTKFSSTLNSKLKTMYNWKIYNWGKRTTEWVGYHYMDDGTNNLIYKITKDKDKDIYSLDDIQSLPKVLTNDDVDTANGLIKSEPWLKDAIKWSMRSYDKDNTTTDVTFDATNNVFMKWQEQPKATWQK